jgi:hypothetical protein
VEFNELEIFDNWEVPFKTPGTYDIVLEIGIFSTIYLSNNSQIINAGANTIDFRDFAPPGGYAPITITVTEIEDIGMMGRITLTDGNVSDVYGTVNSLTATSMFSINSPAGPFNVPGEYDVTLEIFATTTSPTPLKTFTLNSREINPGNNLIPFSVIAGTGEQITIVITGVPTNYTRAEIELFNVELLGMSGALDENGVVDSASGTITFTPLVGGTPFTIPGLYEIELFLFIGTTPYNYFIEDPMHQINAGETRIPLSAFTLWDW